MPYRLSSQGKSDWPTEEEEQVLTALRAYVFDADQTTPQDFTAASVLYDKYRAFAAGVIGSPPILSRQQFGVALRRVFHLDPERKTQRRINGRPVAGYAGVRGPGSVVTQLGPGNPKWTTPR